VYQHYFLIPDTVKQLYRNFG